MQRTPPGAAATCAALGALRHVPLNECLVHGHALRVLAAYTAALYLEDCRIKPSERGHPLPTWQQAEGKCKDEKKTTASGKATGSRPRDHLQARRWCTGGATPAEETGAGSQPRSPTAAVQKQAADGQRGSKAAALGTADARAQRPVQGCCRPDLWEHRPARMVCVLHLAKIKPYQGPRARAPTCAPLAHQNCTLAAAGRPA